MMSETEIECDTKGLPKYQELPPIQCVFLNDLLLDKILHFALMDDDEEEKRKTRNSCKLVQHFWLKRVDAVLVNSEETKLHLIQLHFKRPWRIRRFVEAFATSPSTLVYRIPFFTLDVDGYGRWNLPKTMLTDLLFRCGSALVKLKISVCMEQGYHDIESLLSREKTPLKLTKLESLNVGIWFKTSLDPKYYDLYARINLFIKSIMEGSECLQEICIGVFSLVFLMDMGVVPYILKNLKLPLTLTKVDLPWNSEPGILAQLLVKNPLPNLIALKLCIDFRGRGRDRIRASEVETVLAHFRHQLLELDVSEYLSGQSETTKITLPVMQRLKVFSCRTTLIEWLTPESQSFDFCFPALKTIRLPEKSFDMDMLQKWTTNGTFCLVEKANISLELHKFCEVPNDLLLQKQMRQIMQTMPNICDLTLTISFDKQSSLLNFIFQEMRQLQKLIIFVTSCPNMHEFYAWFLKSSPRVKFRVLLAQGENWVKSTQGYLKDLKKLEVYFRTGYNDRYQLSLFSWNFDQDEEKNESDEDDKVSEDSDRFLQDESSTEENDEELDVEGTQDYENDSDEEDDDWQY